MTTTVAFVCVQNAGRSQMAYAFAEREKERRGRDDLQFVTGGTRPAERVHPEVVAAMREAGVDLAGRTPREVAFEEVQEADVVVTMGCDAGDVCPANWTGETRDWDLDDPDGESAERVAEIRDDVERRVRALFDEFEESRGGDEFGP